MTSKKGYYLYALIAESKPQDFGPIGIGGQQEGVFTLHHGDLAMVVSRAPLKEYDPIKKNVMAHQNVVSGLMQRYDILPISFGTCAENRQEAMAIFIKIYDQALTTLAKIKNKIELGLKVFWKDDAFIRDAGLSGEEVTAIKNKMSGQSGGGSYLQVLELGEKLMMIADSRREEYSRILLKSLGRIAADIRILDITNEKMVFNAAFLVDKERENEFDLAVNELYEPYSDRLDFKYTGPWPPYNFVDIRIPREE